MSRRTKIVPGHSVNQRRLENVRPELLLKPGSVYTMNSEPVQNAQLLPVAGNKGFRGSVFAGALNAHLGDVEKANIFAQQLDQRSYKQARKNEIATSASDSAPQNNYPDIYLVSRGELLVGDMWRCIRKIAFGSTSVIYLAFSMDFTMEAAVKVCSFSKGDQALGREATAYTILKSGPGIPHLYWFGQEDQRHFMVLELLGPNLLDLLYYCNGKFTMKTVCMLAIQIFETLDWVHRVGCIHREIKPQNFCLGHGTTSRQIFLIDFATAIKFRPKVTVQDELYIPRAVGTRLKGQAIYDSVGAHYGNEHSYRDDLESTLYMLTHFLIGDLPWRSSKCGRTNLNFATMNMKKIDEICRMKLASKFIDVAPPEFQAAFDHVRSLSYDQVPDYELLIHLFLSMLQNEKQLFDYEYDWLPSRIEADSSNFKRQPKTIGAIPPDKSTKQFLSLQTHRNPYFKSDGSNFDEPLSGSSVQETNGLYGKSENERTCSSAVLISKI